MANTDNPNGFALWNKWVTIWVASEVQLAASQTMVPGDMTILNTAGQVSIALATSGSLYGVIADKVTSSSAGDLAHVFNYPFQNFTGQCSGTGTLALIQTTQGTPIDIEGTTGIMEINENATTEGVIALNGLGNKWDRMEQTEIGANQRYSFTIAKHNAWGNVTA